MNREVLNNMNIDREEDGCRDREEDGLRAVLRDRVHRRNTDGKIYGCSTRKDLDARLEELRKFQFDGESFFDKLKTKVDNILSKIKR